MGEVVELQPDLIPSSGLERLRRFVTLAMREIQQSVRDTQDRPIGCHLSETDCDHGHRLIDAQFKLDDRCAPNLKPFGQRIILEHERAAVVGTLIARHFTIRTESAPFSRPNPGCLW